MNNVFLKYAIIFGLIMAMMESNRVPVISMFCTLVYSTEFDNGDAEDPANESGNFKIAPVEGYLLSSFSHIFVQPVSLFCIKYAIPLNLSFAHTFYPDVLTPPPNC